MCFSHNYILTFRLYIVWVKKTLPVVLSKARSGVGVCLIGDSSKSHTLINELLNAR